MKKKTLAKKKTTLLKLRRGELILAPLGIRVKIWNLYKSIKYVQETRQMRTKKKMRMTNIRGKNIYFLIFSIVPKK